MLLPYFLRYFFFTILFLFLFFYSVAFTDWTEIFWLIAILITDIPFWNIKKLYSPYGAELPCWLTFPALVFFFFNWWGSWLLSLTSLADLCPKIIYYSIKGIFHYLKSSPALLSFFCRTQNKIIWWEMFFPCFLNPIEFH